jgi:hypothetical protein
MDLECKINNMINSLGAVGALMQKLSRGLNMVVRGGGSNSEDYVRRNFWCSRSRFVSPLQLLTDILSPNPSYRGYRDCNYESDPRKATIHDLLDIIAADTKEKERRKSVHGMVRRS